MSVSSEQPDSKGCESNDIFICNSNEISNAFNEHFLTIGPRLARERGVYLFKKYNWKLQ